MSNDFYSHIPSFLKFEQLSDDSIYHHVPSDWFVVIADIEGSTEAIAKGRYKDINTLGAAAIAIVQKIFGSEPLPFVFGGDGATFLIPSSKMLAVKAALAKLKAFSESQFDLKMRVGVVSVEEIRSEGQRLEVAKFELAGGKTTAFIRGGGLAWAEYQIKTSPRKYGLKGDAGSSENPFEGLSCRWKPIPSQHGQMLTVLVQPRFLDSTKLFDQFLTRLNAIFGGDFENSSPVHIEKMKYKGLWESIRSEWNFAGSQSSSLFFKRVFELLLCQWAFRFKLPAPFAAKPYMQQIPTHSDYRKYDDMLRLVLDCTTGQITEIKSLLEEMFQKQELFYGTSESSEALMTCLVHSIQDGEHIHFIDGSEGGYALAARSLSEQILTSRQSKQKQVA